MNHRFLFWKQGQRQHVFDDNDDDDKYNYKVEQVHIFQSVHYGSIVRIVVYLNTIARTTNPYMFRALLYSLMLSQ
jgi:hypothetical protein